jgi:molecular chaperone DnaK
MIKNAEQFKQDDLKKRESIEVKNNLDSKIHSVEKVLQDNKDNLTQEIMDEVNKAINEAKEVHQGSDIDKLKEALQNLEQVSLKVGSHIYSNRGQ